jgi:Kef-type K+ transport system membrane component KefB
MEHLSLVLGTLGALLLLGVASELISHRIRIPRVTLLILSGVVVGPPGLGWLPSLTREWYPLVSHVALLMVGFLLGRKLERRKLKSVGMPVLAFSVFEVLGAAVLVCVGTFLAGAPPSMALVLAGVAPASAPAAVMSVTKETASKGSFTDTLLGIVALDDAWGLVVFSLLVATAGAIAGSGGVFEALTDGGRELGGAILIGVGLGVPSALLLRWLRGMEPMQAEALGIVLVAGALSLWLESSFILAGMLVGATIVNLCPPDREPFQAVEALEWPIMVLFFVLAGAEADLTRLKDLGVVGTTYVFLRCVGLVAGAYIGGSIAGVDRSHRRWMGPAIFPQAGVALGMALVAGQRFPQIREDLLAVVIGSTILFEVVGPILTRLALIRVGDAGAEGAQPGTPAHSSSDSG